jgi:hypothetical protein
MVIAGLLPDVSGWGFLEYFFVGLLILLVGLVTLFALFLVVQQFRNPARRGSRP